MGEVREIRDDALWNDFVEASPQGTIFCKTDWLKLLSAPYQIYGYYKNGNLVGGMAGFDKPQPLTPFQGVLVQPTPDMKEVNIMSLHNEVATALLDVVPDEFCNHYMCPDMRPFLWAGFEPIVRYTYVVDLTDKDALWNRLEKDTRWEIKKQLAPEQSLDIDAFDGLYSETFERKGIGRPVSLDFMRQLFNTLDCSLFMTEGAGVLMIRDSKRAYYILGASRGEGTSSACLWGAIQAEPRPELDLVGCNDKKIGLFKRGFGGKLMPYLGVRRV